MFASSGQRIECHVTSSSLGKFGCKTSIVIVLNINKIRYES